MRIRGAFLRHGDPFLLVLYLSLAPTVALRAEETADRPTFVLTPGEETFRGKISELAFPKSITIESGEHDWRLRALGSGLRTKFRIKVYEAVLYAEESAAIGENRKRLAEETERAVHLELHFRRGVDAEKIVNAFREGFRKTIPPALEDSLSADREKFLAGFNADLEKGDVVTLTRLPGAGLITRINGVRETAVDNPRLATALFLIWIGDDPVGGDLKRDLFRLL